jgi:hypothetical protein
MTNRAWLVCAAFIALLIAPVLPVAGADGIPDAATLRERIRASGGPIPEVWHEIDEVVSSDGTTTIEHDYRRGKDFRFTIDTGPFHTERGLYGGVLWHMNDNGQVIVDTPDPGKATREELTTTVEVSHIPVEGYAIATLNAQGRGIKEYVDGTTWRVARREQLTVNGTIVTTFDDVRFDHGRTFAHHLHIENGYENTHSDLRVIDFGPDDVAVADVAVPKPRRALVEFPAGVTAVELPARFGNTHIYVRVTIAGRGLDFVLDSGAGGITIDADVARQLGLKEYGKHSTVTARRYTTGRTIVPEIRVGSLTMRNVAIQEVPHGWLAEPDVKEVGLLGFDFLAELGVTVDYERHRVTVVPGSAYVPPSDPSTIPLDVRVGSGQPRATVLVNGALGERFIIDTGAAGPFLIFDYFARRHPEALRSGGGLRPKQRMTGIGGSFDVEPYQIASLKFASVNFTDFVGYRVMGGSYAQNDDGIVGVEFLKLFTLGFDYANSRLYLVPNSSGRAALGLK